MFEKKHFWDRLENFLRGFLKRGVVKVIFWYKNRKGYSIEYPHFLL